MATSVNPVSARSRPGGRVRLELQLGRLDRKSGGIKLMSTLAKLLMGLRGAEPVPTEPGTPYGGGFYAGRIMIAEQAYALVVAPKAQGGGGILQWKTVQTSTDGTDSRNDGWANTQAMIQAGSALHPAAAFCRGLNINGYNDWYLPSQDELEILYRAFKPTTRNNSTGHGANPSAIPPTGNYTTGNPTQTSVAEFRSGGGEDFGATYYWCSTQDSPTLCWAQHFNDGMQNLNLKTAQYSAVRAVRRVAI